MRKNVKAGMGLALIVVIVAGWYYTRDNSSREPIALGPEASATPASVDTPTVATTSANSDGSAVQPGSTALPHTSRTRPTDRAARADRTSRSSRDRTPAAENREVATTDRPSADRLANARSEQSKSDEQRKRATQADASPASIPLLGDRLLAGGPEPAEPNDDDVGEVLVAPHRRGSSQGAPAAGASLDKNQEALGAERGAPAAALEAVEFYKVQPNDTLEKLANIYYGNKAYADLIMQANPAIREPNALRVGMEIRLPAVPRSAPAVAAGPARNDPARATDARKADEAAPARTAAAETAAPRTYVVRSGDSFYRIAERLLGAGARWPEVLELNRELVNGDPQRLRPGMEVRLPPE
jgi:nucleoid-associated protein YgaU